MTFNSRFLLTLEDELFGTMRICPMCGHVDDNAIQVNGDTVRNHYTLQMEERDRNGNIRWRTKPVLFVVVK